MTDITNDTVNIVDRLWKKGKKEGLSDNEIKDMIEKAIQEKLNRPKSRKKYNYTPMTDEEIKASQDKINSVERVETVVIKEPQVLYGPPPMEKVEVVHVETPQVLYGPPPVEKAEVVHVEMPQVLYGPPPKQEMHEMFSDGEKKEERHFKK